MSTERGHAPPAEFGTEPAVPGAGALATERRVTLRGTAESPAESPVVVLRPSAVARVGALLLVGAGATTLALGWSPSTGAVVLVLGLLLASTWIPRVELGPQLLAVRRIRGRSALPVDRITAVRLVRIGWGQSHPAHTSLRLGRFRTTPLRLCVEQGDRAVVRLTVVAWDHWAALGRHLVVLPHVASDGRTLGRLDRYG